MHFEIIHRTVEVDGVRGRFIGLEETADPPSARLPREASTTARRKRARWIAIRLGEAP
jgi:hypothetical protein